MKYTYDENTVSDLHKDAYGFRPREAFWLKWNDSNDNQKQVIWDDLLQEAEESELTDRKREMLAVAEFEIRVAHAIESGAKTREMALRWIMQGSDANGDWEYLCYLEGLPYHYFKQAA